MDIALEHIRELDRESCRRARLARDRRFDGEFFVAVRSTGIYCRPVCPARLPAERNVSYYRHAAQAAQAGYRPCLRCRPETAPGSPAWIGSGTTVQRALQLIRDGALDGDGSVALLAARLGVGARYLNKLFQRELGVSPSEVAKHQRLLLARMLIVESGLSLTEVAFAAGFGSVRRFNSALREAFGVAPGTMRRRRHASVPGGATIRLALRYRPPYDWPQALEFLQRHAVDGLEQVADGCYRRQLQIQGMRGELAVSAARGRDALLLELDLPVAVPLRPLVSNLRRMFDLDANPAAIAAAFAGEPVMASLLGNNPGIRCLGHFSAAEAAVRAIVGQQISTAAARRICAGFAAATGGDFPSPEALLELPDDAFPMPGRRRETLRELGRRCAAAGVETSCHPDALADIAGVGPWTTAMAAMRGWGAPDVFPERDLGIVQAWRSVADAQRIDQAPGTYAGRWSPFRSYAAALLWRTL
jgi:AraC family transcriptional regulator of adaptative response / DNA-3-methyladenine glycosylase II